MLDPGSTRSLVTSHVAMPDHSKAWELICLDSQSRDEIRCFSLKSTRNNSQTKLHLGTSCKQCGMKPESVRKCCGAVLVNGDSAVQKAGGGGNTGKKGK